MEKKDVTKRGRRPLRPFEKATRHALAARRRYEDLVVLRKKMLGIKPADDPKVVLDKNGVAEKRLETARLAETQRILAKSAKDDQAVSQLKEMEVLYRSELNNLPPLGFGFAEWLSLSALGAKRPVGKQPMALELRLCRAQIDWELAEQAFKEEAARSGLHSVELKLFQDTAAQSENGKVGRPAMDDLGELDAKIRHYERRISEIKAFPETAFLPPSVGRKPIPRYKRIEGFQNKIVLLEQEIAAKEAELGLTDILRRRRKRLWNERFILANTSVHQLSDLEKTKRLEAIDGEMAILDAEIDTLSCNE